MTLNELKPGESCRVVNTGGEKAIRRRLLEMGITPRTVVTLTKTAPSGDPIEIFIRGYTLTLRLADAERITVEAAAPQACDGRIDQR